MNFLLHVIGSITIFVVILFVGHDILKKKIGVKSLNQKQESPILWISIISVLVFNLLFAGYNSNKNEEEFKNNQKQFLQNGKTDASTLNIDLNSSNESFLSEVKENQNIYNALITDANFLAISVMNDGMDKTPMARSYCIRAAQRGIKLSGVKILDASNAKFERGAAYGTELAKSFCN